MVLSALRGALGFCSRLPVGRDDDAWQAVRRTPAAFPLTGWVLGPLLAAPLTVGLPAPTLAVVLPAWVVAVTGINHLDGLADLGDAAAVHGDPEKRRSVMRDTTVGVGGVAAVGLALVGLAGAGVGLAGLPLAPAVVVVVASEVSAKLAVAALVCLGEASHDGLGAEFATRADGPTLAGAALVAAPLAALGGWGAVLPPPLSSLATVWGWPPLGSAALLASVGVAAALLWWTGRALRGVGGDAFGAANELARVAALHAGVVAWTCW